MHRRSPRAYRSLVRSERTPSLAVPATTALTVMVAGPSYIPVAGNRIIDGGGGVDAINSRAGNDTVSYYGSESAIDGGAGSNTLVLQAVTTVNLGNLDQTTGDGTAVANFQNGDA